MRRAWIPRIAVYLLCLAGALHASGGELAGTLRCAGDPAMAHMVSLWAGGFERLHPKVHVDAHMSGTDTAVAFLYTAKADVALVGRSAFPIEIQAFEWVYRYKPLQVEIMTGSDRRAGSSPALVVMVNEGNPMKAISVEELARLFGSSPAGTVAWRDLGVGGAIGDLPVRLFAPDMMSGTGRFFRHAVLADSRMLRWAQITEVEGGAIGSGSEDNAGQRIARSVASDPAALGIASLSDLVPGIRVLPIRGSSGAAIEPNRKTVGDRTYPLSRACLALLNVQPGKAPEPLAAAFLDYVLSEEGQRAVANDACFIPLDPARAAAQRSLLTAHPQTHP